jgi:hypothetical protein
MKKTMTITEIKDNVKSDFGVTIDTDTAKTIRDDAKNGGVVWTPRKLQTISGITIVPGKIL